MIELGRFNNQSEVVREALRRMEREESSYLNPRPLSEAELKEIYAPSQEADKREVMAGKKTLSSIRRTSKRYSSIEDL